MTQGDGDRIGGIIGFGGTLQTEQPLGHIHDLMLGGVAVAHHCLLDLHGFVGINLQPCLTDGKENDPPTLGDPDAGGDILTEKQLFNCYHIRLRNLQKPAHILIDHFQPGGKIHAGRGSNGTAAQKLKLPPLPFNQPEAGNPVTGIDS